MGGNAMKTDDQIFLEWFARTIYVPHGYKVTKQDKEALMNTLNFRSYVISQRFRELIESIKSELKRLIFGKPKP